MDCSIGSRGAAAEMGDHSDKPNESQNSREPPYSAISNEKPPLGIEALKHISVHPSGSGGRLPHTSL